MKAKKSTNPIYWMMNELPPESIKVLRQIAVGSCYHPLNRFEVAYLIARECVSFNKVTGGVTLTDKGEDAFAHYGIFD